MAASLFNFHYSGRGAARMCQAHRSPGCSGRPAAVPTLAAAHLLCVFLLAVLASCACVVDAGQAALPTSTGGGRRLLACDPFDLEVKNECKEPMEVTVVVQLSEDVEPGYCNNTATTAGEWCMRPWLPLAANESGTAFASVTLAEAYVFAHVTSVVGPVWYGPFDSPAVRWFDTETGEPCEPSSPWLHNSTCRPFGQATSSSCPNSTWMVAPITCAACDVFFTNNCSLPVQLAVHSQLFDDKAPGFCAGTYNKKGDWCTRAGFALAPGETSSRALGQVYLGNFFFWASATDANNRTADWTDEAAADAPYVDLLTGNKCSPEDAITCKLFRSSNQYQCHNVSLSCPNLSACTIPHCLTYTPDARVCACATCEPGYSGSQCTACNVSNCLSYSSECSCRECAVGYRASGGGCVACPSTTNADPHCKSYGSACSCTTCVAGYRLTSYSTCSTCGDTCSLYVDGLDCMCQQCKPGWQLSAPGICLETKSTSSSTAVIAGAAAGAAVAAAVAVGTAVFLVRRRRRKHTQAPPADGGEKGALDSFMLPPPGMPHNAYWGSGSDSGGDGNAPSSPTAPHSSPPQPCRSLPQHSNGGAAASDAEVAAPAGFTAAAGTASELATSLLPPPGVLHRPDCGSGSCSGPSPRSSLLVPPGASSEAPSMSPAPSRAGTASLTSASTSNTELLSHDPLISYFQSQLPPLPGTSGVLQERRGSQGGVELRPWEVRFDDLVFRKPVGEGSYGRVYLAEWAATQVAVKVLIAGQLESSGEVQRALALSAPIQQKLEAEASLLASLRHPYVVNFMAICREPPCIVTEYCARGSLAEVLAAARTDPAVAAHLTWPRRLAMAADAAAGMLYVHTRPSPIVHRDLKSPNLLVDESWHCKVSDLNLSKILEDTTHSSSIAAMNPRWLAPELMRGHRATPASDVFSFGVVLHELLTWQLPWGAANPWLVVSRVLAGGRLEVPPREALPGPDTAGWAGLDGYVALMQHCWAQAPEDRPSFQDIVVALRELMEQAGGTTV